MSADEAAMTVSTRCGLVEFSTVTVWKDISSKAKEGCLQEQCKANNSV